MVRAARHFGRCRNAASSSQDSKSDDRRRGLSSDGQRWDERQRGVIGQDDGVELQRAIAGDHAGLVTAAVPRGLDRPTLKDFASNGPICDASLTLLYPFASMALGIANSIR